MNNKKGELSPLPTQLSEQQIADLESDDAYLRGTAGLSIVNESLREMGVQIPQNYVFKKRDRKAVETAIHSTFDLMGGVPGMIAWAIKNPNNFYSAFMKLAPVESNVLGVAQVIINSQVPDSPLDIVEIDAQGRVIDVGGDDDF